MIVSLTGVLFLGCWEQKRVAVLFVGHGEPAAFEDGNVPIGFWDGSVFGPHAAELGVPLPNQVTEWAAAYEEIATAIAYSVPCTTPVPPNPAPSFLPGDSNCNGTPHEILSFPIGDVPPFFTWGAFLGQIQGEYTTVGNYSPHNDLIAEHVAALNIGAYGKYVDKYLAYLDAVPRIPDVLHEIAQKRRYKRIVVVPLLLADSTHTQEVEEITREWAGKERHMEIIIGEPYFEVPYMRQKLTHAIAGMAEYIRSAVPAGVGDDDIGVILAAHGTPYVPPYPEFGWIEGDIYSKLTLTEGDFHADIAGALPWAVRDGRMNYGIPSIKDSIADFAAEGKTHIIVVPSAFPTAAIHTMWDVANAAVDRPVLPAEGIVAYDHPVGVQVYYTAKGYADVEPGRTDFQAGLRFMAEMGLLELFENNRDDYGID